MRLTWSLPVHGERLDSGRGDLVRARRMIESLRADGHDVRVVEAAAGTGAAATSLYRGFIRRVLPRAAALVLRDVGRAIHARAHARRVVAAAHAQGAELIVETQVHFSASGARAARRARLPLVLDDCSPASEEVALGAGLPALARRMFRRQTDAAAAVVVSSRELARVLRREGVAPDRIRIVPNGIDTDAYARADRDATRARFGFGDACVAAFVGSFQPWHRADLLALAIAGVDSAARIRVLLVGDGPGLGTLLDLARWLGVREAFTTAGAVPASEVPGLLAGCDVGVLPGTNAYGQPMKLLEYAAAGLPAVAPDLPPVRAAVEPGRTGLLFPSGDAGALARALGRLAADPSLRAALGGAARARVGTDADWRDRARDLLATVAGHDAASDGAARIGRHTAVDAGHDAPGAAAPRAVAAGRADAANRPRSNHGP